MQTPQNTPVMKIDVRKAIASDLPALRELFLQSRRATYVWQANHGFQLKDFDVQTEGEQVWVAAHVETGLLGFISVWQPSHFIHHIYVDPGCSRHGIGRALLHALPGWTNTHFQLKCLRRNTRALAFYKACGFTEIGTGTAEDGEYLLLQSNG